MAQQTAKDRQAKPKTTLVPAAGGDAASTPRELVDMEQAIALLRTSRPTFYRWLRTGQIKGMKVGRQWRFYRDDLERFVQGESPRIELRASIDPLIESLRSRLHELGGKDAVPPDSSDVPHAVTLMILLGTRMRASDFAIEPQGEQAILRYRLDGVLHRGAAFDIRLLPPIIEHWKTLCACNPQEKNKPQDGVLIMTPPGNREEARIRVCFLPAAGGESMTGRILTMSNIAVEFDIDKLGFSPRDKEQLLRAIAKPWGLVIVTGPTNTGKTTMLYSIVKRLATPECRVITIEDPVECTFAGTTQVQIRPDAGLTFSTAFRAALRCAPNIIMVGEIRDGEVAGLCIQAALTGHLIFTTLHTNDSPTAIKRLVDVGVAPHLVADTAALVISQRLVRKLCPHCSKPQPREPMLDQAMAIARRGGLDFGALTPHFRQPVGCPKCNTVGYCGRMLVAEVMPITPELGSAIRRGSSVNEIRALAIGQGMTTLAADGLRSAAAGLTTVEEVIRTIGAY